MKRSYQQVSSQQQFVQLAPSLKIDMSILTTINQKIQKKCPDIQIHLLVQQKELPFKLRLELHKEGKNVSTIQIVVSAHTITISSDTYDMEHRQKKYNSVLRYVVILLASSMTYRSYPIQSIHSNAVNWKSAKALFQRQFVPTQVFTKNLRAQQITPQKLRIFQDTQRLKQTMSGDQQDERKPWLFVLMELDLSTIDQNRIMTSLTNAIDKMIC